LASQSAMTEGGLSRRGNHAPKKLEMQQVGAGTRSCKGTPPLKKRLSTREDDDNIRGFRWRDEVLLGSPRRRVASDIPMLWGAWVLDSSGGNPTVNIAKGGLDKFRNQGGKGGG